MTLSIAPASVDVRRTLSTAVVRPSWAVLGLAVLVTPLLPLVPSWLSYLPFVVSALVFGLPHGAVDHLVPARTVGTTRWRSVVVVVALYVLVGGLYLAWWFLAPVSAAVFFILLTWFHWGQGDVYFLLSLVGVDHLPTRPERGLALVVRGGLPMVAPLAFHPVAYQRVAGTFVALFDGPVGALDPFFTLTARLVAGGGLFALTLVSTLVGAWRVRAGAARRPWFVDVGELALLWLFFAAVPPVLAVGLYFTVWHALRHIARLLLVDPPATAALRVGNPSTALRRFSTDAAPLTVVSLVLFVGLALVVPADLGSLVRAPDDLLALYLVGIAVLTLPHVVVVTWMDRVQGVW
jgi:Brp/Blh family beta-carotene 15,15'-monooxygenase